MAVSVVVRTSLLALLAACSFDGEFAGNYRCGVGDTCPSGEQCVAGRCTTMDPEAPDAAVSDVDASEPAPDASPSGPRFTDSFGDGVLNNWLPWTHTGCTVTETGGAAQLDYTGSGDAYCGLDTETAFDLTTGSASVHLIQAPTPANFENYLVVFSPDTTQQILMILDVDGLQMFLKINGTSTASATIPNPGEYYWRIRNNGTTTFWDTSTDGATWNTRHSTSTPVDASSMQVELAAGHYTPGTGSAVRVKFDDVIVE